jgi:4a-hydroxytetrahydrobiopterin dehydratase
MTELVQKRCTTRGGALLPLSGPPLATFQAQLPFWKVIHDRRLAKSYLFPDLRTALPFVDHIAEVEGHHPHLYLCRDKVDVRIYTRKIEALSENDFILPRRSMRSFSLVCLAAVLPESSNWLA